MIEKSEIIYWLERDNDVRDLVLDIVTDAWRGNRNDFYKKMGGYDDNGKIMLRGCDGKLIPNLTNEELEEKWVNNKSSKVQTKIVELAVNIEPECSEQITQQTWFNIVRTDRINSLLKLVKAFALKYNEKFPHKEAATDYVMARMKSIMEGWSNDVLDDIDELRESFLAETYVACESVFPKDSFPRDNLNKAFEDLLTSYVAPSSVRIVVDKTEPKNFVACAVTNKKPTVQEAIKHILKDAVETNSYGIRDLMDGE